MRARRGRPIQFDQSVGRSLGPATRLCARGTVPVSLELQLPYSSYHEKLARTDERGYFYFKNIMHGGYSLAVGDDVFVPRKNVDVNVTDNEAKNVSITAEVTGIAIISVSDEYGGPLSALNYSVAYVAEDNVGNRMAGCPAEKQCYFDRVPNIELMKNEYLFSKLKPKKYVFKVIRGDAIKTYETNIVAGKINRINFSFKE